MNTIKILSIILFSLNIAQAQIIDTLNQEASPKGGINQLAIKYYGIEFTKEQRASLKDKEIEFIFQVDEQGKPVLSEINGINDVDIIDSLKRKTDQIEYFNPAITDGVSVPTIYFMQLQFPSYEMANMKFNVFDGIDYRGVTIDDFEYMYKSNSRYDILVGGMTNSFFGKPSKHLGFGGGMKVDVAVTDKRKFIYGLNMSAYGNKLKEPYPINSSRDQFDAPSTLLVGAHFGKWFNQFNLQAEFNFAVQNLTEKFGPDDTEWTQLNGWSSGVVVNYPIILGKEKPTIYYRAPSLLSSQLNLHFGVRYLKLPLNNATGMMAEFGISYRMAVYGVKDYKLKDEYFNN